MQNLAWRVFARPSNKAVWRRIVDSDEPGHRARTRGATGHSTLGGLRMLLAPTRAYVCIERFADLRPFLEFDSVGLSRGQLYWWASIKSRWHIRTSTVDVRSVICEKRLLAIMYLEPLHRTQPS